MQLSLRGISKSFGAVQALTEVDLDIRAGEVVALMGDNGAGKSTLVKILAGNFLPDSGTIAIDATPVSFYSPSASRTAGIEVVYQDLALCDNLTAAANIFLGRELKDRFGLLDDSGMERKAVELFRELESDTRPAAPVRNLSGGQRQAVAIARACLESARLLMLDEPTAAISVRQVAEVLSLIRRLQQRGTAVVLISHRMSDIFEVSSRVVVLRRGRKVGDIAIEKTTREQVTGLITGAIDEVSEHAY